METVLVNFKKLSPAEEAFREKVAPVVSTIITEIRGWNGGDLSGIKRIDARVMVSKPNGNHMVAEGYSKTIWPVAAICPRVISTGIKMPVLMPGVTVTVYRY